MNLGWGKTGFGSIRECYIIAEGNGLVTVQNAVRKPRASHTFLHQTNANVVTAEDRKKGNRRPGNFGSRFPVLAIW